MKNLLYLYLFHLCLAPALAAASGPVKSLLVHVVPHSGGFGDVAANLLMIEKLADLRPSIPIQAVVSPRSASIVQMLIPGFEPNTANEQHLRLGQHQISFIVEQNPDAYHSADIALAFSIDETNTLDSHAHHNLKYGEPADQWVDEKMWTTGGIGSAGVLYHNRAERMLRLNTGTKYHGLYLGRIKHPPPLTRHELEQKILPHLKTPLEPEFSFAHTKTQLAYAYSKFKMATEDYLKAIALTAAQTPDTNIVVFIKDDDLIKIPALPANVRVHPYSTTSLEVSKALIAHADLPSLVTGDASLSIAIDFEKPFFYENNSWKRESIADFSNLLASESSDLQVRTLRSRENASHSEIKILSDWMLDKKLQEKFQVALAKIRTSIALPDKVWQHVDLLHMVDARRATLSTYLVLFEVLKTAKSLEDVPQALRETIGNTSLNNHQRSEAAKVLLSLKQWDSPENLDLILHLFFNPEPKPKKRSYDFFRYGLKRNPTRFQKILDAGLASSNSKIRAEASRARDAKDPTCAELITEISKPLSAHEIIANYFQL